MLLRSITTFLLLDVRGIFITRCSRHLAHNIYLLVIYIRSTRNRFLYPGEYSACILVRKLRTAGEWLSCLLMVATSLLNISSYSISSKLRIERELNIKQGDVNILERK